MTSVVLHCEPRIPWQPKRAAFFVEGFKRKGIECEVTDSRQRIDDRPAVLLGTSCWRAVEATGNYLLVDRCSFGDTEHFVSLVWNGHGLRGDHRVPRRYDDSRWRLYGQALAPMIEWREGYEIVLCGQTATYSPDWLTLEQFYSAVGMRATAFRPHPAGSEWPQLKTWRTWENVGAGIVLNSSVGCEMLIRGISTWAVDQGAMCYPAASKEPTMTREELCHWLAWTQFTDDEVREGVMWDWHL
jgi:hypothetical protein